MPVGETKACDGRVSCFSGLKGEFSEETGPSRHSGDLQVLISDVSSADDRGRSGTCSQSTALHCTGGSFTASKFWALSMTNPTSAPPWVLSSFWGSLGNSGAAIRGADSEVGC